jgi:hypothetical protein
MLNPILEELMKEGRIKVSVGKKGDIVYLIGHQMLELKGILK